MAECIDLFEHILATGIMKNIMAISFYNFHIDIRTGIFISFFNFFKSTMFDIRYRIIRAGNKQDFKICMHQFFFRLDHAFQKFIEKSCRHLKTHIFIFQIFVSDRWVANKPFSRFSTFWTYFAVIDRKSTL